MLARDLMSIGLLTFLPDMGLEAWHAPWPDAAFRARRW